MKKGMFVLLIIFSFLVIFFIESVFAGATNIKIINDRWPDTSTLTNFGESSIQLMNANTGEEKALAIWRFIQQTTHSEYGSSIQAREPAYGITYMEDPIKLLNVYGLHYCDPLSRIMIMTWRSIGGRAAKYYKWGHTLAEIWYKDYDNIDRPHLFDISQFWFVYTRSSDRVASSDDIMGDF